MTLDPIAAGAIGALWLTLVGLVGKAFLYLLDRDKTMLAAREEDKKAWEVQRTTDRAECEARINRVQAKLDEAANLARVSAEVMANTLSAQQAIIEDQRKAIAEIRKGGA